jgi:hypothetical protein
MMIFFIKNGVKVEKVEEYGTVICTCKQVDETVEFDRQCESWFGFV